MLYATLIALTGRKVGYKFFKQNKSIWENLCGQEGRHKSTEHLSVVQFQLFHMTYFTKVIHSKYYPQYILGLIIYNTSLFTSGLLW